MCIPGVEPETCSGCITIGSNALISNCPNQKEASLWQEYRTLSFIRYSFSPFIGSLKLEPRVDMINSMDLTKNGSEFSRAWKGLTRHLIPAASSSRDESRSSHKYYEIDVEALSDFQTLYGLMQCTPDLLPADCNLCLRQSVGNYQKCCLAQEGGIIIRLSCFFRVELYPFFLVFRNITARPQSSQRSPTPSLPNQVNVTKTDGGRISTGTIVAIVVSIVVFIFIIILGLLAQRYAVLCWTRKSYQDIDLGQSVHSLQFDFKTVEAATNNFSESNKIGRGGFGEVFKAMLPNGIEVAVKHQIKAHKNSRTRLLLSRNFSIGILLGFSGFVWKDKKRFLFTSLSPTKASIISSSVCGISS